MTKSLLGALAPLVGIWTGAGHGEYPTIAPFDYLEEVTFGHVGKPFLSYAQKTRHPETGAPMHAETGFWRPVATDTIEVVLAHPTGIQETLEGSAATTSEGLVIDLASAAITLTSTAKSVTRVERRFVLADDTLHYTVAMAAVGLELTHHLEARLTRSDG